MRCVRVGGGIIGPPPRRAGTTRLYLSGSDADTIAELFEGTSVDARAISRSVGAASALKMTYAAWTGAVRSPRRLMSYASARGRAAFRPPFRFLLWEGNYFFSDLPSIVAPVPEPI
jgi:hypothetical protein